MTELRPTPGARMVYLIKRRPETSRDELVMHWFANHMPLVIANAQSRAQEGKSHAWRYVATLFDPTAEHVWDGMAQLWWDFALRKPKVPIGTEPTDSFQQKAEPYVGWATTEYVVLDGQLPSEPLLLNDPFPSTRSGFFKVTSLIKARPGADHAELFGHWLEVHAPNVRSTMEEVGGFRYVVGHSVEPESEDFAGLAELYFPDASGWRRFIECLQPDGIEKWLDPGAGLLLTAQTEMIGIP